MHVWVVPLHADYIWSMHVCNGPKVEKCEGRTEGCRISVGEISYADVVSNIYSFIITRCFPEIVQLYVRLSFDYDGARQKHFYTTSILQCIRYFSEPFWMRFKPFGDQHPYTICALTNQSKIPYSMAPLFNHDFNKDKLKILSLSLSLSLSPLFLVTSEHWIQRERIASRGARPPSLVNLT